MVSACVTAPVQLPDFEAAKRSDVEITNPVLLPALCEIPFNAECYTRLDVFEDIAFDNTELAQLNADIARDGEEAYDYILSAATSQQEIAKIRQEMLEAERRDHFFTKIQYGGMVFLLTLGLIL